ncbi:RNA polymerase sigma factor SigZ [Amphritea sp.]|uniref:RNA polymerase sigma factor SigZ n=1 Tax=Amphritea sp. TaxID=1872502 RepID=UPI003A8D1A71
MNIEVIWTTYRTDIKSFLHSKISNPVDVEELLQETFIRAYQNIDNLNSKEKVKSWLFMIARNITIDFYRKNNKTDNIHPEDLWHANQDTDTEHVFSRCVQPLINDLSDDMAKLLTAIDLQGQSQKKYAENLGISYSTLKSRVQKGRKQLHELFHEYCDISVDRYGNIIEYQIKPDKISTRCQSCA